MTYRNIFDRYRQVQRQQRMDAMKKITVLLMISLFATSSALATDAWDINQNYVKLGAVDTAWTVDPNKYEGTRAIFDGRFSLFRKMGEVPETEDCCPPPPPFERLIGVLNAHFMGGDSETNLEYTRVSGTALAYQRDAELEAKKFMTLRDTVEFGDVMYSKDDPLGVDYYIEFTLARLSRTWAYKFSDQSPWTLMVGIKVGLGYAWASSVDPVYADVANPIMGGDLLAAVSHPTWGQIYTNDRVINGYTFSSPDRGDSTSREAAIRFGYFKKFQVGLTIDAFFEKRSFNFGDARLPDLYTKSRRIGGEIGFQF
jgi:hypothetical protein